MRLMPRNLSAWIDLSIQLVVMLALIGILLCYSYYIAAISFLVWCCLVLFAKERCKDREKRFERYCKNIVSNVNEMMNYAVENLPQAIFVLDEEGKLQWFNSHLKECLGRKPEQGVDIREFWPNISIPSLWGREGDLVYADGDRYYSVRYCPIRIAVHQPQLMAFYVQDASGYEHLRNEYLNSRAVLAYIQVDNYDEVMQGLNESEQSNLLLMVRRELDEWMKSLGGFMRKVAQDLYVAVLERHALDKAIADRFDILDKMHQIQSMNRRLPVTLSMGIAVADTQSMEELGRQAQAGLDLALGRGGDQATVLIGGKASFFGGRTKAVEKHTRVRVRVVAHVIREAIEASDDIYIMGHHNEDFDCFGAAMGVAKMAQHLGKTVHIVLSDMNEGIDKLVDFLKEFEEYEDIFLHVDDMSTIISLEPLLFVVDTHIPHLTAAPSLLDRISKVIVIDHHRRSEDFIKNTHLVYLETASSSTSELVTELLMYFSESLMLSKVEATALYSGIVVDTKNFAVQTGVRTFDAAAYLRRSGADPVMVHRLFRTDYDTTVALAQAKANAQYFEGGLIVAECAKVQPNGQIIAAQAADSLLRVENVRMSIVVFQLKEDVVAISARSSGGLNVQVIMEKFGGGGHQNVAGAQIKNGNLKEIKEKAIELCKNYIEETDQDESDIAAGH